MVFFFLSSLFSVIVTSKFMLWHFLLVTNKSIAIVITESIQLFCGSFFPPPIEHDVAGSSGRMGKNYMIIRIVQVLFQMRIHVFQKWSFFSLLENIHNPKHRVYELKSKYFMKSRSSKMNDVLILCMCVCYLCRTNVLLNYLKTLFEIVLH